MQADNFEQKSYLQINEGNVTEFMFLFKMSNNLEFPFINDSINEP